MQMKCTSYRANRTKIFDRNSVPVRPKSNTNLQIPVLALPKPKSYHRFRLQPKILGETNVEKKANGPFTMGKALIVKLHSELAFPTELQLERVGVDFVFPPHN